MIEIGKRAKGWLHGGAFATAALLAGCATTTPGTGVTAKRFAELRALKVSAK